MKLTTRWTENMCFTASDDENSVNMDTKPPIGTNQAMTPKQLVIAGLAGCTAMDVIALMRKHKQTVESFEIESDIEKSSGGYPEVFTRGLMIFKIKGVIEPKLAIEAVMLSQTKYCGVSAMLSKAFPIHYQVILNGETITEGQAKF
jgi:putative redox protein